MNEVKKAKPLLKSEQLTEEEHRIKGKHSNIPDCCVEWFVFIIQFFGTKAADLYYQAVGYGRGYIPCPVCLVNNVNITIHKCDITCIGIPGECFSCTLDD